MSLVGKIKTLFSDKEKTEPMFPRTKVKAVSDDEGVGLNVILENMVYSSEMVDGTSTVPVNADTLGGRPADEYALGVEVDAQVDELRTELQADIDGLTYADVGAAPQATVTSVLSAKGWYRVGKVAARYNDNAGGAAFRITVGSVYNNFINSTSIVEGVSSYDNGQLSTLFSWGGGYPITSVRLCQVSESQKASVYIDVYYNQSNTNNCFVTVDTTTGTFTPNSALTAVTTSETVVCETTLSGRYPFTTAHTIPITNGGTGATTSANALTNLGAAPASHNHDITTLTNFNKNVYDAMLSRTANTVLAAPNGSDGSASFRKLVAADLPTVSIAKGGTGATTAATALKNLGAMSKKLLWTNASPSSSFGAQSISCGIANFDEIEVVFLEMKGTGGDKISTIVNVSNDYKYYTGSVSMVGTQTSGSSVQLKLFTRTVDANSASNGVQIGICECVYNGMSTSTMSTDNNYLIPFQIYGIKGVQ